MVECGFRCFKLNQLTHAFILCLLLFPFTDIWEVYAATNITPNLKHRCAEQSFGHTHLAGGTIGLGNVPVPKVILKNATVFIFT